MGSVLAADLELSPTPSGVAESSSTDEELLAPDRKKEGDVDERAGLEYFSMADERTRIEREKFARIFSPEVVSEKRVEVESDEMPMDEFTKLTEL